MNLQLFKLQTVYQMGYSSERKQEGSTQHRTDSGRYKGKEEKARSRQ